MRIFAVGDIQGCYDCLRRLLDQAGFDADRDQLWCVGDLVNRGPESLATLRFLRQLGEHCVAVLGNHDLHLLRNIATGSTPPPTLRQVTQAADCAELIAWLRHRPLLHLDATIGWAMVHAGLHPGWSMSKAIKWAHRITQQLQADNWQQQIQQLLEPNTPTSKPKKTLAKQSFALAIMTRGRFCTAKGEFNWKNSGTVADQAGDAPWFLHPDARWRSNLNDGANLSQHYRIVFGHWASMGLVDNQPHVLGLDSGCVWGNRLTLARLDRKKPALLSCAC
ncbi:MAG: symmetrical bis(5'-nucleosyl)-tetraphosphatase [Mariprofundales bacterium]